MKPTPGSLWTTDITDEPKTLLALRVQAKVDDLFRALWVAPELQEKLHKLRNDFNMVETPWVASKGQLPQAQFSWEPPAPAPGGNIVASSRWRKASS
ncbi:hypothetical protein V8C86DRAFT_2524303 [Haematococcus lacustris]